MSIKRYDVYGARESSDGPYVYYQDHVSELARLMERCMDEDAVQEALVDLKALVVEMENPLSDRPYGLQRSLALINEALLLLNTREPLDRSSL